VISATIRIFVPDVPEFAALVRVASGRIECRVTSASPHYFLIESTQPIEFSRKELGLKPAVWYGLFTGGLAGRIERFDREIVRIVPRS
jgi:hypothetical protein